jgi:transcriptional regulator with XRE-family HTH domain
MEHDDDLQSLGSILHQARREAGLSVRDLATQVSVHFTFIGQLESGKKNPSPELLQRLADVLNLDINDLLQYIGLRPTGDLPSPRMYFRRKFGISEEQADVLARLIEHQMTNGKEKKPNETTDNKGGD